MNNSHVPWVILVPKRAGMREIYELNQADQAQAFAESLMIGKSLMEDFGGHKLNTGTIGNMVPQLHWHHIVRYEHDLAWPKPVWGNLPDKPYTHITRQQMLKRLRLLFGKYSDAFSPSE